MTPEQINIMIKFAKVARRSAKANKVLWNMVRELIDGTDMKLQLQTKEGRDGKTYEDWLVVKGGDSIE